MERALGQLDVITCIVANVESDGTLTRLARTSRMISAAALDRLWRKVNILVLARCMPVQYWDEIETFTPFHFEPGRFICGNGTQGTYTSQLVSRRQILRERYVSETDSGFDFRHFQRSIVPVTGLGRDSESMPLAFSP
jgi:hypothetical protein